MNQAKRNWLIVSAIIVVSIFIALSMMSLGLDFIGVRSRSDEVSVEIKNTSASAIAKTLKRSGIINNRMEFMAYEKFYRKTHQDLAEYRKGKFLLNPTMSYNSIIRILAMPEVRTVKVTLAEGMSTHEIANKLEEEGVCSKNDFLKTLEDEEFDFWFLKEIPTSALRMNRYEGYLYPDTYEFFCNESPKMVLQKIFENFDKKTTKEMQDQVAQSGFTLDEIIILASIVQKEDGSELYSPKVASVLLNRLSANDRRWRLDADATIEYVEKHIKPYIKYKNQELYDAYNTYKCNGLPVGPICSPGSIAINSVLSPEKTDYLFYVVDKNGNYYWSRTLSEHEKNVRKASSV